MKINQLASLICFITLFANCTKDHLADPSIPEAAIIHYVDYSPDSILPGTDVNVGANYELDLNNDSLPDLRFTMTHTLYQHGPHTYHQNGINLLGLNGTQLAVNGGSTCHLPLDSLTTINANSVFGPELRLQVTNFASMVVCSPFYDPPGYVGFRIQKQGNYYYGWIKLSANYSATLYEYGYNETPGGAILIGQK